MHCGRILGQNGEKLKVMLSGLGSTFAQLKPFITATKQNWQTVRCVAVFYNLRSNIFDGIEFERLPREAIPPSDENTTADIVAPQVVVQPAHVDAR
ncbi:unnamed protein product [Parnassius apollo]|uniref:(apollo) hypothetical protein n=1 Tax=Parnassius apollo TaxID=110799 RepID=A0A8S3W7N7_PARAO|nr:unnamed protein product [Parnassius apollo]